MSKDALLEIGSEELPAHFITLGIRQLKTLAQASLEENKVAFAAVETFGTPRRLAVVITGLADRSEDQRKTISGPPAQMARDHSGQWTPAAIGFARKQGLQPTDLTIESGKLCAVLDIKGVATKQLLSELFPQWIQKLEFPKAMTWEPSHFRYPRPVRWIAAVYGTDVVSFTLAGVRSGRWTYGLGHTSTKKIAIGQPGKYVTLLKNQCVLVQPSARQEAIRRMAEQTVRRVHGKAVMHDALLEEVANLVEHPVAILGNFDAGYLDLPSEVLITCLEHHQKFFPVVQASKKTSSPAGVSGGSMDPRLAAAGDDGGALLNHFIGIRNGMSVHQEVVREGYERVLAARLADARFFFNQDRKTPLVSKVDALKGVIFQEKLGHLYDKKERVKVILQTIAGSLPDVSWVAGAQRVADLCKADLVTDMVREFPELQGIMAKLYAELDGEKADVAQALEQHYWPITLTSPLPETELAAVVALADKLDTLAGDFAVGLIPSGSADPYGLRRTAVGVLRILEARGWPLSLEKLLEKAIEIQPAGGPAQETFQKLAQFMRQRLGAILEERGYKFDEIDAVLATGIGELLDTLNRLKALHELRSRSEFEPLSNSFKRAMNIVKQALKTEQRDQTLTLNSELLKEPCEQVLYQALGSASTQVSRQIEARAYREALESLVSLREPLDGFFGGVMVMADDPSLRANRLALMEQLVDMFSRIADFSKLQNA